MNTEEYKTELENLRDSIKELKERYENAYKESFEMAKLMADSGEQKTILYNDTVARASSYVTFIQDLEAL